MKFFALGDMIKDHLFRYLRLSHKGVDAITPKIYLNDGAITDTLTAVAAATTGEHKTIQIKRRAYNAAIELTSSESVTTDHEIRGLELEVDSL